MYLKPCPFCDGKAQVYNSPDGCEVFCTNCYVSTTRFKWNEKKAASDAWNRRVVENSLPSKKGK